MNAGDEKMVKELWRQAIDNFKTAPDEGDALARSEPLLRQIGSQWPNTEYGVRAQLFTIETLAAYVPGFSNRQQAVEFVDRALRFPRIYFSQRFQASSQAIAADAVRRLAEDGNTAEAWRFCFLLRWAAPRVDRLAPTCRAVMERQPPAEPDPESMLAARSPPISVHRLSPEGLDRDTVKLVRHYVTHPYDAKSLEQVVIALWNTPHQPLAVSLRLELLQLDHETFWRIEYLPAVERK